MIDQKMNGYSHDPMDEADPRLGPVEPGGRDPLADVRALVARATNVEYALVANHVCSLAAPRVLSRDCSGVAG